MKILPIGSESTATKLNAALSRRRCDPIKLAYKPLQPDGWFELPVSAFHRLEVCQSAVSNMFNKGQHTVS